jgi:hypothetical protein
MKGEAPSFIVDPALMQVSYGDLELPADIKLEKTGDIEVTLTWSTKYGSEAHASDQVMFLAYDVKGKIKIATTFGDFRHIGTVTYPLGANRTWHIWFAMNAHDRSRQSHSIYLGEITM